MINITIVLNANVLINAWNVHGLLCIPVCTRSAICSSDIVTDLSLLRNALPEDGKQPPEGFLVVVVVVVTLTVLAETTKRLCKTMK